MSEVTDVSQKTKQKHFFLGVHHQFADELLPYSLSCVFPAILKLSCLTPNLWSSLLFSLLTLLFLLLLFYFLRHLYFFILAALDLCCLACGLSCPVAYRILGPQPGASSMSPVLEGGFLTKETPGKHCFHKISHLLSHASTMLLT